MLTIGLGKTVPERNQSLDSRWSLLAFSFEAFANTLGCMSHFEMEKKKKKLSRIFLPSYGNQQVGGLCLQSAVWRPFSARWREGSEPRKCQKSQGTILPACHHHHHQALNVTQMPFVLGTPSESASNHSPHKSTLVKNINKRG